MFPHVFLFYTSTWLHRQHWTHNLKNNENKSFFLFCKLAKKNQNQHPDNSQHFMKLQAFSWAVNGTHKQKLLCSLQSCTLTKAVYTHTHTYIYNAEKLTTVTTFTCIAVFLKKAQVVIPILHVSRRKCAPFTEIKQTSLNSR